jgi:hypothetical protein
VGWSGSDTGGSGIDDFNIQYRITTIDGTETQGWTSWINPSSNPGSQAFSGMVNNRTYHFRARANDNAGNTGGWSTVRSISVDLGLPDCTVGNLPIYTTSSSFTVTWSGSDGESGLDDYDIQVRVNSGVWGYLNNPDGSHTTATSDNVNGVDGNFYEFRCRSYDVAGNQGLWSAIENTTVDATPPITSVDSLEEWLNVTSFIVSWSGYDETSGIDCYDIQHDDGTGWSDWFTCTTSTSDTFGPSNPVTIMENTTYSFRSRGWDNAGNQEAWPPSPDAYTTIDLSIPDFDMRAFDATTGLEISGYAPNLQDVILRSIASDSISGVIVNRIEYTLINDVGESSGSQECGPGDPYGGVSQCEINVDFAGGIILEYWVTVIDRAGNMVVSEVYHIGTHPLANFAVHNVYMSLGEMSRSKIQVRNIQSVADNVTINLSGNMPIDPYFIWIDDPDVEITGNNNMTLIVKNINPGEQRIFYALLWSSDDTDTYHIDLDARSAINADVTDSDQAIVQIGYPASFPGLDIWTVLILVTLATLAYAGIGIEKIK